jgi:hypothetical protein
VNEPTIFWGPTAFAIMGGLLVATVLTLNVTWFRVSEPAGSDMAAGRA